MGRKHDKHEKARGKVKDRKDSVSVNGPPPKYVQLKGCHVPEPIVCSVGSPIEKGSNEEGVLMECTNESCPFSGQSLHLSCFHAYEDHLVRVMSNLGSARGWTDAQRRVNLWEKKGQSLVAKVGRCRCGAGTTRRDEMAVYNQMQKARPAPAVPKKKGGKGKLLPKANFGSGKPVAAPLYEDRDPRVARNRSTRACAGRRREISTSSMSSTGIHCGAAYDNMDGHLRRESLTYADSGMRTYSVLSGHVADQEDDMSICSDPFHKQHDQQLSPPLRAPPQTRSYAAAIKPSQCGGGDTTTPLGSHTDSFLIDSGVEMKSGGSSTGSEGGDVSKDLLSPCLYEPELSDHRPDILETPKVARVSKPRAVFPMEDQFWPLPTVDSKARIVDNGPQSILAGLSDCRLCDIPEWTPFEGSSFYLAECIIANSHLPGLFQ